MMDVFHGDYSDVYYKLYRRSNGIVTIVCMQDFDETDYNIYQFISNSEGRIHRFETEEMAIEKINEWFKPEEIDPDYSYKKIGENIRD